MVAQVVLWSNHRIFTREGKIFFFRSVQTVCGNHPVSYPLGTGRISPLVKWQQRQANHSTPSGAEGKNEWSFAFTVPYVLMTSCLIKHKYDFVFSNV